MTRPAFIFVTRLSLLTLVLGNCGGDTPAAPDPAMAAAGCPNPKPLSVGGQPTGYVSCDGDQLHRAEIRACPSGLPRAQTPHTPDPSLEEEHCRSDADCTERPNGHCEAQRPGEGISGWFCQYGCLSDGECGVGQICVCGDPVGRCAPARCASDANCPGSLCASGQAEDDCTLAYACLSPTDECRTYQDCPVGRACQLTAQGRRCRVPPADSACDAR